jgi:hypothetical protein
MRAAPLQWRRPTSRKACAARNRRAPAASVAAARRGVTGVDAARPGRCIACARARALPAALVEEPWI